jgi:hypothetical protein
LMVTGVELELKLSVVCFAKNFNYHDYSTYCTQKLKYFLGRD